MAEAPRTVEVVKAEIAEWMQLKKELLKIPVSGASGRTSVNYAGRIDEINDLLAELEAELIDLDGVEGYNGRPQIIV